MGTQFLSAIVAGLLLLGGSRRVEALVVPGDIQSPTIINFSSSPVGPLDPGVALTTQYSLVGALFDGHTITPPGPPGMSSFSGLPGLEAGTELPFLGTQIRIDFNVPVRAMGAFFLMGSATDPITLRTFDADNALLQSVTLQPAEMTLRPGPFGFNEGFIGVSQNSLIAHVTFDSGGTPYVIDDLHFSPVPEPTTVFLAAAAMLLACLAHLRRRRAGCKAGTR